jgi:alpha-L-rhamnosidase
MNSGFASSFHESLGGIRPDEDHPGFQKFYLKPTFLEGLEWCEVSYKSPQGEIQSHWKRNIDEITWTITIPENSTALVKLPMYAAKKIKLNNKKVKNNRFELTSGKYDIIIK